MRRQALLVSFVIVLAAAFSVAACGQAAPAQPAGGQQAAPAGQSGAPAAQQVIKWRGQLNGVTTGAPFGPFKARQTGVAAVPVEWSEWLKDATGGRLQIDWAELDAIYPSAEGLNAASKHIVDIAISVGTWHAGTLPEANIDGGLPFSWANLEEEMEAWTRYGLLPIAQEAYAEKNIFFLPQPTDALVVMGTNFAAPNPEAVRGKKIRGVGAWNDYTAMLGGSPVTIPWGEIYMGFKLGTFDGWIAGAGAMEELKLKEVTKGIIRYPLISTAPAEVLINMDALKALPADLRTIVEKSLLKGVFASSYAWNRQNAWVLANAAKEYNIPIYDWSAADQKKVVSQAVEKIWATMAAKNPRSAKMIEILKQQMKDYGRL